ncbi:hypothetical protein [Aquidulcibacter sp.]|jgi:hypothetical protein|uniref:hypothetical protein n=1 Tax=Aquidulcibacter sp. TaxID=2052990 RepID=UPI00078D4699|nr:hypothetical protein AEM38_03865 [Hyphomonadaceae bacterium UKL13-1]OYU51497.1 MAG: hypothetical protein CFE27_12005 [Alphaproteobacteria bacterium PA1]HCP63546.1 hypothetical protein [Hyphomonadaceae bacterium]
MEIVNGYMCRDCTDVSYAKKNIDPAHPKDSAQPNEQPAKTKVFSDAVQFGGLLADLNVRRDTSPHTDTRTDGPRVNLIA